MIDPRTPYVVVDKKTGKVVYETTYANRRRARRVRDRRDDQHGGYRYICKVIRPSE